MGQVIALSGWKGSGKDFAAEYLRDTYGFQRLALADILKGMVTDMFGISRNSCDDRVLKEQGLLELPVRPVDLFSEGIHNMLRAELSQQNWTPRALCILLGSVCRSVDPDYWVRQIINTIRNNPNQDYVITDVRYRNEIRVLEQNVENLLVARVNRVDSPGTTDPSENDLNDWKFGIHLDNRSSAQHYYKQLDQLVDTSNRSRLPDGSSIRYGSIL